MNARQKAKKYKKIAESYKDKAEEWDKYIKAKVLTESIRRSYGTIETLKVVKWWDDRAPKEFIKEKIAQDIAECLLREGYIDFKVDDDYDEHNMCRKIIATIKIAMGGNSV